MYMQGTKCGHAGLHWDWRTLLQSSGRACRPSAPAGGDPPVLPAAPSPAALRPVCGHQRITSPLASHVTEVQSQRRQQLQLSLRSPLLSVQVAPEQQRRACLRDSCPEQSNMHAKRPRQASKSNANLVVRADLLLLVLQLLHGSAQHPAHRSPKQPTNEAGSHTAALPLPEQSPAAGVRKGLGYRGALAPCPHALFLWLTCEELD